MTLARETGDYRVLRLIGEGGMGKVYEAEERLSGRRVALKVLHHELGGTSSGRRHFVTEMAILASLDDPHIVRCLHCTEIDGQLVMALEYLEGRTLRELLKDRGAPAPTASCTDVARRWTGDWSLATVATEASRSSWIGGRARYDLSLRVEGCRVIGSGQRFVRGEESWVFTVTGEIEPEGTAVLAYAVPGRTIGGTWTIEPSGSGAWRSKAGDVSGTLTLARRP
jgi:hypothetical protein